MTDIVICFSASRFSRFLSAFNGLLNSSDDGALCDFTDFFKYAFTFYPESHTVSVRLSPSEHVAFTRDYIWFHFNGFAFTPLPRFNGHVIQVVSV